MKIFKRIGPWLSRRELVHSRGVYIVLAAHFAILSAMIVAGNGIPYVVDNNETFSSLNHAYNLWNFDFFRSFGLTDEAVSPHAAAHPFIHTHQGNFPRLFAFVLFALGARSAESQIWITSFTIGTIAVLFAFSFLRRLAGDLFATIATLLLVTDYLLFVQWQVNTYRVWHGFFLFGSLLCVHGLSDWKRGRWIAATFFLYAGLFYWELVFAAFTAISAAIYALIQYWRRPRLLFLGWTIAGLGALCGIALVVVQLVLYLGWHDFVTDLRLTITARNFAPSDIDFVRTLRDFYDTRNIVFFYNLGHSESYAAIFASIASLFRFVLQTKTSLFVLLAIIIALAPFIADNRPPNRADTAIARPIVDSLATKILCVGLLPFAAFLVFPDQLIRGAGGGLHPSRVLFAAVILIIASLALAWMLRRIAGAISSAQTAPAISRSALASIYFAAVGILLPLQNLLYSRAGQASALFMAPVPDVVATLLITAAGLIGGVVILAGRRSVLGPWSRVPGAIAPFLISGALGYAIVYRLSGGCVNSGYLSRLCPLPVFHADTLLALAPFLLVTASLRIFQSQAHLRRWARLGFSSAAAVLFLAMIGLWTAVQWRQAEMAPPTQFTFVNLLARYQGQDLGLVSNDYVAPFGFVAQTWAYNDVNFARNYAQPATRLRDNRYLWLADRFTNKAYAEPGLFVCFYPMSSFGALIIGAAAPTAEDSFRRCSSLPIVRDGFDGQRHRSALQEGPELVPVARDENDRWAILRLKWPSSQSKRESDGSAPEGGR